MCVWDFVWVCFGVYVYSFCVSVSVRFLRFVKYIYQLCFINAHTLFTNNFFSSCLHWVGSTLDRFCNICFAYHLQILYILDHFYKHSYVYAFLIGWVLIKAQSYISQSKNHCSNRILYMWVILGLKRWWTFTQLLIWSWPDIVWQTVPLFIFLWENTYVI